VQLLVETQISGNDIIGLGDGDFNFWLMNFSNYSVYMYKMMGQKNTWHFFVFWLRCVGYSTCSYW